MMIGLTHQKTLGVSMLRKPHYPIQNRETGEWRYRGRWFDHYPSEEVEKDEYEYERACDMEKMRNE